MNRRLTTAGAHWTIDIWANEVLSPGAGCTKAAKFTKQWQTGRHKRVGEALVRDVRTTLVHVDSKRSSSACCQAAHYQRVTSGCWLSSRSVLTSSQAPAALGLKLLDHLIQVIWSQLSRAPFSSRAPAQWAGYQKNLTKLWFLEQKTGSVSTQASHREPAASLLRAWTIMVTCHKYFTLSNINILVFSIVLIQFLWPPTDCIVAGFCPVVDRFTEELLFY